MHLPGRAAVLRGQLLARMQVGRDQARIVRVQRQAQLHAQFVPMGDGG
jgi:hypothetical protein